MLAPIPLFPAYCDLRLAAHSICLIVLIAVVTLIASCDFLIGPKSKSGWRKMESGTEENLHGVWGFESGDVFAVGDNGTILHFDGTQWNQMESNTTANLAAVWGGDPDHVLATGDEGTILYYDGTTWSPMASGTTAPIGRIWGVPTPSWIPEFPFWVYAVGGGPPGTVLYFNEFGWQTIDTGAGENLTDIIGWVPPFGDSPLGRFILLAVGENGAARIYDGENWSETLAGTDEDLVAVLGDFPNNVYVIGGNGTVIQNTKRFIDTGPVASWREIGCLAGEGLSDIAARHYNDLFIMGANGQIVNFDRLEFTNMRSRISETLHAVWAGTYNVFAVGDNGTILRYSKAPRSGMCPINVRVTVTPGAAPVINWSPACPVSKVLVEDDWGVVQWFVEADGNLIEPGVEYGSAPPGTIVQRPTGVPLWEGKLYRVVLIRRDWNKELVIGTWNLIPEPSPSAGPVTLVPANKGDLRMVSEDNARIFYFQHLRRTMPGEEIYTFSDLTGIVDGAWRMLADPVERENALNVRPVIVEYLQRDPETGEIEHVMISNMRAADLPPRGYGETISVVWDVVNED